MDHHPPAECAHPLFRQPGSRWLSLLSAEALTDPVRRAREIRALAEAALRQHETDIAAANEQLKPAA